MFVRLVGHAKKKKKPRNTRACCCARDFSANRFITAHAQKKKKQLFLAIRTIIFSVEKPGGARWLALFNPERDEGDAKIFLPRI